MPDLLALAMIVVELGSPFGGAGAAGSSPEAETIEVVLQVELVGDGPVLAHLLLPGEDEQIVPLIDDGSGTWGTTLVLRRAEWQVVFEAVAPSAVTAPVSLTELGLDRQLLTPAAAPRHDDSAAVGPAPWGWLSLACGAAGTAIVLGLHATGGAVRPRRLRRSVLYRHSGPG